MRPAVGGQWRGRARPGQRDRGKGRRAAEPFGIIARRRGPGPHLVRAELEESLVGLGDQRNASPSCQAIGVPEAFWWPWNCQRGGIALPGEGSCRNGTFLQAEPAQRAHQTAARAPTRKDTDPMRDDPVVRPGIARRGQGMSPVTGPVWAAPCPSREGARTAGRPHRGARPAPPSPQAGIRPPARPSVAVRGKPTVRTDRPGGPDAVRYASVDTAMHRLTVTHRDTRRDKKETARLAENSQLAGRFRR